MSVKHAVLGLVIEKPGYGYELIQRLGERIEGWRPSYSSVYPALHLLRRQDMIRARELSAAGGRPAHRSVVWYEATDAGRVHFREWMVAPSEPAPVRDELQVKIAFAALEDLPRLVEQTRTQEQACLDRLLALTHGAGDQALVVDGDDDWRAVGQLLLRDAEVAHLRTTIVNLQRARAAMKRATRRSVQVAPRADARSN
jgi:DNA-binding PadR family transcriptional regulator